VNRIYSTRRLLSVFVLAAVAVSMAACGIKEPRQVTSVDRVLMAPSIENAPYRNIIVIGATPSRETARSIEQGLTQELSKRKVEVHSFVRESPSTVPDEESVMALIRETGADGVIVVSPKVDGAELTERSEQVDFDAETRGGRLINYFRYDYKEITRPSYIDYTVNVVLVSDFYDVESLDRIHSVESSTAHGKTGYDIIMAESRAIVSRLRKDRLIR
jgi:hypothetical protein